MRDLLSCPFTDKIKGSTKIDMDARLKGIVFADENKAIYL